jgi:hypothetical protein
MAGGYCGTEDHHRHQQGNRRRLWEWIQVRNDCRGFAPGMWQPRPMHGVMVSSRSAPLPSVELFVPRVMILIRVRMPRTLPSRSGLRSWLCPRTTSLKESHGRTTTVMTVRLVLRCYCERPLLGFSSRVGRSLFKSVSVSEISWLQVWLDTRMLPSASALRLPGGNRNMT